MPAFGAFASSGTAFWAMYLGTVPPVVRQQIRSGIHRFVSV